MSSMFRYALPVEQTQWAFEGQNETVFSWEYDDVRAELLKLYDKGKKQQWDAAAILENDNRVAQEFDARRVVAERLGS
jgi:hypothetical protein